MCSALSQFYTERIFNCTRCQQRLMNPYLHRNQKHDPPQENLAPNRRRFLMDSIKTKADIRIVFVGEAPGLDGCGYGGIAFTGEHNAVHHLGLSNYHGSLGKLQKEKSADMLYGAMADYCQTHNQAIQEVARRIYLTNAVLCVPLGENCKSIVPPGRVTAQNCQENLVWQLEHIRPKALVTLGNNALLAVASAFDIGLTHKLTDLVARGRKQTEPLLTGPWGMAIIPELHPSPRNRVLGDMYTSLPNRLVQLLAEYLGT